MTPQGRIDEFFFFCFIGAKQLFYLIHERGSFWSLSSMSGVAAGFICCLKGTNSWQDLASVDMQAHILCACVRSSHSLNSASGLLFLQIIRSSGIGCESFVKNLTIISAEACDCRRKFTWTAFKFLWSCLFCSPWKHTISTSPLW